ncbi:MAG: hypothetical protein MJE66_15010 [Proteobacteria bacterium]|nr:hypothetical protein [Pseudomonadota bacterium]
MVARAHGVLVEVHGVGVLLLGASGVGKSECALELVGRGHRLVADDVVELRPDGQGALKGRAPETIRHYVEIRGVGLMYIPDLYGRQAVRDEANVDLLCRLEAWSDEREYERVGLTRPRESLAGVELPSLVLAGRPAGSLATVVEAAALDHRQRAKGLSGAERIDALLRERGRSA